MLTRQTYKLIIFFIFVEIYKRIVYHCIPTSMYIFYFFLKVTLKMYALCPQLLFTSKRKTNIADSFKGEINE